MKKYEMELQTNASCPKKKEIAELIRKEGGKLSVKTVIGGPDTFNRMAVYFDSERDENKIAVIKTVMDGDKKLTDDEIKLLKENGYTIEFKEVSEDIKNMTATLTITEERASADISIPIPRQLFL